MSKLRPRLCVLEKGPGGYGFHLHGEKGKSGQFIRLVEPDTPAAAAGLLAGDRLVFVNGESVEGEGHQQVVARIRATSGALELIVVDPETSELLKKHGLQCRREFATEGIPLPGADRASERGDSASERGDSASERGDGASERGDSASERADGASDRADAHSSTGSPGSRRGSSPVPAENGDASSVRSERLSVNSKDDKVPLRPRLCHIARGTSGYGFNLHSDKSKPGQYIRAVDEDSPAQKAGLRPQDKIVQVNGTPVLGMQHSEVVAIIKSGGDETRLLVVDAETDEFFRKCSVVPTEQHVTGPLPDPSSDRASGDEAAAEAGPKVSVSSSASDSSSSDAMMPAATSSSLPEIHKEPEPAPTAEGLALGLSLAQARERAHQKRAAKKAPPMDWSKRNELFSNL